MGKTLSKKQKEIERIKEIKTALRRFADNENVQVTVGSLGDGYAIVACGEEAAEAAKRREAILISGGMKELLNDMKKFKPSPERATKQNTKGQKVPCLRLTFVL